MVRPRVDGIIEAVREEAERAMKLYPGMNSRHEAFAVIYEEIDEFWELVRLNPKKMTAAQNEEFRQNMRTELIQIAAMCIRSISDLGLERDTTKTVYGALESWDR